MNHPTSIIHSLGIRSFLFGFGLLMLACATQTYASDHIDSPSITQDRGSDLADTYAFLDPNDNSHVVLIMSTQDFVVSGEHFGMAILRSQYLTGEGDWVTVDRDGNPAVNNDLIPAARKDEYNAASTADDAAGKFKDDIVKSLTAMGTDEEHMAKMAVENGDILRLDLTVPNKGKGGGSNKDSGFEKMGGRRLQDDVMDMVFTMVNNGEPLSDKVDENEKPFQSTFPFVADPTQPFAVGSGADDHTRQ